MIMSKMQVNMVIEIMGRPIEHVAESLKQLVEKMANEKGVTVLERIYHDPIKVEKSEDLFTTFAEITAEFDSLNNYFGIIFAYLPSHIEIINPEKINMSNYDLTELGNRILHRLHEYDAITKKILMDLQIANKKISDLEPKKDD